MSRKPLPDIEAVHAAVDYDPDTGRLTWKRRDETSIHVKRWNTRFAEQPIGSFDPRAGRMTTIFGRGINASWLAWVISYGEWPAEQIDHIDGDPDNQRLGNLRLATSSENNSNRRKRINNTSGYKGVNWHKRTGSWRAEIKVNGDYHHLGIFPTKEAAYDAYCEAAKRLHGSFANLGSHEVRPIAPRIQPIQPVPDAMPIVIATDELEFISAPY